MSCSQISMSRHRFSTRENLYDSLTPMLVIPPGYEQRVLDVAKRALDDIPECRDAEYKIRWNLGQNPLLVIAFVGQTATLLSHVQATPAVAIGLRLRKRGSDLTEFALNAPLLEGDRLRDHILHSVHHYLEHHKIRVSLTHEEGERLAKH